MWKSTFNPENFTFRISQKPDVHIVLLNPVTAECSRLRLLETPSLPFSVEAPGGPQLLRWEEGWEYPRDKILVKQRACTKSPLGPAKPAIWSVTGLSWRPQDPERGKAWVSGTVPWARGRAAAGRSGAVREGRRKTNTFGLKLARVLPKAHSTRK